MGTFWKKLFSAAIFEIIFSGKECVVRFWFSLFSYNFGPSLLLPIRFGRHTTFILSQFLDHSGLKSKKREQVSIGPKIIIPDLVLLVLIGEKIYHFVETLFFHLLMRMEKSYQIQNHMLHLWQHINSGGNLKCFRWNSIDYYTHMYSKIEYFHIDFRMNFWGSILFWS